MSGRQPLATFAARRLFVTAPLRAGQALALEKGQSHYLRNVLRLGVGDGILLFNGQDGEWAADIVEVGRGVCRLVPVRQVRLQESGPDIELWFAPLKRARLDYMVQKATEMGVARLRPALTERTQVARVNLARMRANVVEAAEQCGILRIPQVAAVSKLPALLAAREAGRHLIFCDEAATITSPLAALEKISTTTPEGVREAVPLAVLIGPEGGFSPTERALLYASPAVTAISLGPRILRADTAATAALALVNAVLGDWMDA